MTVLQIISCLAALLYISVLLSYSSDRHKKKKMYTELLWGAGVLLSFSVVTVNLIRNGYMPFVSIYQILCFLAFMSNAVALWMRISKREFSFPFYIALSAILSLGLTFMDSGDVWHFPPALRSVFFIPHVLAYMIAYVNGFVTFLMTIYSLVKKDIRLHAEPVIYAAARITFPFMTAGMFIGAIWANDCWGKFWSWDVKECWSLFTWLCYAVYLHFMGDVKLKKYAVYALIAGFFGIIITMFFVGYMNSSSPHIYS